jgi:hypothetical protein
MSGASPETGAARPLAQLIEAAHACAGSSDRAAIVWADLWAWPEWALPSQRQALARRVLCCGALRHADALRGCIDGPLLQAASELIGRPALLALLQGQAPVVAQLAALPQIDMLEPTWRAAGRALLAAELAPGRLRSVLLDRLGWPEVDAADLDASAARGLSEWLRDGPLHGAGEDA